MSTPSTEPATVAAERVRRDGGVVARARRFAGDRVALGSLVILLVLLVASGLLEWLRPQSATQTSADLLRAPSFDHLLGTDELGRDLGLRLLVGARSSLEVAFGSALFGLLIGVAVGLVGGYFGRWIDAVFMRMMDLLLAVPMLLVALVVVVMLGPSSINVVVAIGVASVPLFARLARASVLEVRERDYVAAAKAMGAGSPDVMVKTILPNIVGPIIVQFVVTSASAVVVAASLSFLGLGVPPPAPTWGAMLHQAQSFLFDNPWYGVFPGIALAITVLLLDRIGKGLERAFGTRGALDAMAGSS